MRIGPQAHIHPHHEVLPPEFQRSTPADQNQDLAQEQPPNMTLNPLQITSTLPLIHSPYRIPQLGFGIYQSPSSVCVNSCLTALKTGYKHIDSAQFYRNEREMGEAVRTSGMPRSEIFLTTKILSAGGTLEKSYKKCLESVTEIDGNDGYVDLFLIHTARLGKEKRKEIWLALERLVEEGKVRNIGVSNWGIGHIEEMKEYAKIWPPAVNQIELHPFCQQRAIVSYCRTNNIVISAYCPLVRNLKASNEIIVSIAKKHSVSTNQVLVRYSLQKGWNPLPKSDTPERIEQNADVFGFELDEENMKALDELDEGDRGALVEAVVN